MAEKVINSLANRILELEHTMEKETNGQKEGCRQ